jgi:signal transduction histidine kinase
VKVVLDIPRPLPVIQADRDRLKQVWTNLLANAVKFSQEGGRVLVRAGARGGEIVVEVLDQGPGIRQEDLEKIFERFCQSSSNLVTDKPGGTGLGLTIAKEIVENHDGRIEVESELGGGSLFRVRIPVKVSGGDREAPTSAAVLGGGGRLES